MTMTTRPTRQQQNQNQIRMIDRLMSSDTEYHIATLNRYYPCFKSKSVNAVKVEIRKRCQVSSSVEDESMDTSDSMDVAMDDTIPSSSSADDGQKTKPSVNTSCYRRQRTVSYTDEDLIQETTHPPQSSQPNSNNNRKVSFLDKVTSHSIITAISYRPTTTQHEKNTLYYTKEDYEMFIYDEYTERILLEEEEEKVFSWEDLLCYDGGD